MAIGIALRKDIVARARAWIGTPYLHQGRCKGAGVDCIGLVIGVAQELSLSFFDTADYGRLPSGAQLLAGLREHARALPTDAPWRPAQIALMRFDAEPQHLGILAGMSDALTLIHAYSHAGAVAEHRLADVWRSRVIARFDFPGVQD